MLVLLARFGLDSTAHFDEYQYLMAAALWPDLALYRDFHYSQTPYFPVALSWWMEWFGGESPNWAAKVFNVIWAQIFVVVLWLLCRWIARSALIATLITFAVTASPVLSLVLAIVRNDMMAVALAAGGVGLVLLASDVDKPWRARSFVFFGGLLLALSVGTKQSMAFLALAALAFTLFVAGSGPFAKRALTLGLPLALGGFLGGLPMLALALADWPNFLFATTEFHRTAHAAWTLRGGRPYLVEFEWTLYRLVKYLIAGSSIILAICLGMVFCLELPRLGRSTLLSRQTREGQAMLFVLLGLAFGVPVMLLAKPMHVHYPAPLLLLLAVGCAAAAYRAWQSAVSARSRLAYRATAAALFGFALWFALFNPIGFGHPLHHGAYFHLFRWIGPPEQTWAATRAARIRADFREVLGPPDRNVCIATLMPFYPVEAGYNTFRELAGSPFFYRTNEIYEPSRLRELNGIAPAEVESWLARNEVQAVLVGFGANLDGAFRAYAEDRGFQAFEIDLRDGHDHGDKEDEPLATLLVAPSFLETSGKRHRTGEPALALGQCGTPAAPRKDMQNEGENE